MLLAAKKLWLPKDKFDEKQKELLPERSTIFWLVGVHEVAFGEAIL